MLNPMIAFQSPLNPTVLKRYRPLAGPFADTEESLFRVCLTALTSSHARVVTVGERDGVTIYRLAAECETMEETEARLRRLNPKSQA